MRLRRLIGEGFVRRLRAFVVRVREESERVVVRVRE
jgi:hypothetical protein